MGESRGRKERERKKEREEREKKRREENEDEEGKWWSVGRRELVEGPLRERGFGTGYWTIILVFLFL